MYGIFIVVIMQAVSLLIAYENNVTFDAIFKSLNFIKSKIFMIMTTEEQVLADIAIIKDSVAAGVTDLGTISDALIQGAADSAKIVDLVTGLKNNSGLSADTLAQLDAVAASAVGLKSTLDTQANAATTLKAGLDAIVNPPVAQPPVDPGTPATDPGNTTN